MGALVLVIGRFLEEKLPITKMGLILISTTLLLSFGCQKQSGDSSKSSTSSVTNQGGPDAGSTSSYPKRYLVESGIVEYEMTGMQKGTETIYFDRWGWREAKYTNTEISIGSISRKENRFTIMDGEWIYNIDLEHRTATKTKNPMLAQFIEAAKKKDQSLTELGEEMMRNMGGEKGGTDTVAGQPCDVWVNKKLGSKSCVWKGVTLKSQLSMAGMQVSSTATRFSENATIPADKTTIPSDVKITEGPDVKRILEGMKKPGQNP